MINKQELIRVFLATHSYTEAARRFGVSRQRIHQLLTASDDPRVQAFVGHLRERSRTITCSVCARSFMVRLTYRGKGLCKTCCEYQRRPSHRGIRILLYPMNCRECGVALVMGRRSNGMCRRCYQRLLGRTPEQRERMRRWEAANPEKVREMHRRSARKYWATHREQILTRARARRKTQREEAAA
jgi:hypothetical protein